MIKCLITISFKTGYSQRKVNVALVITTKDALQNSNQSEDTFIIFSLTVQFFMLDHIHKKRCSPVKIILRNINELLSYSSCYNSLRRRSVRIKISYS